MITYLDRYSVSINMVRWAMDTYITTEKKAYLILAGQGLFDCASYLLTQLLDSYGKKHVTSDSIEYLCSIALMSKSYTSLKALSEYGVTLNTWKANKKLDYVADINYDTLMEVSDIVAELADDIIADME